MDREEIRVDDYRIDLTPKERQLLQLIHERGRILTRVKERWSGDKESVQPPVFARTRNDGTAIPSVPLADEEVLPYLHALEARGLIESTMTVLTASGTEYVRAWRLCKGLRRNDAE
jgi:hypothetical protein